MLIPTIIMGIIAVVLLIIAYNKGGGVHIAGLKSGMTTMIQMFPILVFALVAAGLVPLLIPEELMSRWIGAQSGFRGILIGSFAGSLVPGGPYGSFPLALGLLRSGAGVGTMVAFLTGWSLIAVTRLPLEVGILGWKLALIRLVSVIIFPPIAGLIADLLFGGIKNLV